MRSLGTLSFSITILLMITVGGMIPSAVLIPKFNLPLNIVPLSISWQVPALLFSGLAFGTKQNLIAVIAYLTIGLFYFPIFHGGGSLGYVLTPEFGYLLGFLPAVFITGRLTKLSKSKNLIKFTIYGLTGLLTIHFCGIMNLIIGAVTSRWQENLLELVIGYTILPLLTQIAFCPAISILAILTRQILFIE